MKMKLILTALLFAGFAAPAGDPAGFSLWKAADLKAFTATLGAKMGPSKTASQPLTSVGNYAFSVSHREGSGAVECHLTQADIFVIESGEASITVGGTLVDGKNRSATEMTATAISGGTEVKVGAGDVVTIPAKMPHQMKLEPGKEITYFVVKVTQ
jgi:mannose-6-phosphate isomerase-like protein (cupin superfamily)